MKIRVISHRDEIPTLSPGERIVHIAFRPSNKDIFHIVETCPKVEAIQLPQSYKRTISKSILVYLEMQKIQLLDGCCWGFRKDISDYYIIPESLKEQIKEMKNKGIPDTSIVDRLERGSQLTRDTIRYVIGKVTV